MARSGESTARYSTSPPSALPGSAEQATSSPTIGAGGWRICRRSRGRSSDPSAGEAMRYMPRWRGWKRTGWGAEPGWRTAVGDGENCRWPEGGPGNWCLHPGRRPKPAQSVEGYTPAARLGDLGFEDFTPGEEAA